MTKFPLVKELGLEILGDDHPENFSQKVYAADIERLLSQAPVVYSGWHSHERGHSTTDTWSTSYWPIEKATHTARLIGVKPIKKPDTAEDLLLELIEIITKFHVDDAHELDAVGRLADRALELLKEKE